MHLAAVKADVIAHLIHRLIAGHIPAHLVNGRTAEAPVGTFHALVGGHIVFIRKVPREIGGGKWLQTSVVKWLDGIHVVIRHFLGAVYRYTLKLHGAGAPDVKNAQ